MRTRVNQKKSEKDRLPSLLIESGIRPTRQRLAMASILFDGHHKHVTAEQVLTTARRRKISVSLATVYNNLHEFTQAGLLREVSLDRTSSFFDTNTSGHHHFFDETTGNLWDIPEDQFRVTAVPKSPPGRRISRIEVVVRLSDAD